MHENLEIKFNGEVVVGYREMVIMTGYSIDTLRTYNSLGRLPEPDHRIGTKPYWKKSKIEEWMKKWKVEAPKGSG